MKVARPPVFVNVHLGPSALVALLSRVALFGARNGWLRLGGATLRGSNLEADGWPLGESSSASLRRPARCSLRSTAPGALLCALCLRQFRRSRPRSANSPHAFSPPPCAHPRAPCAPKSSAWRRHHLVSLAHTALQEGQVDWVRSARGKVATVRKSYDKLSRCTRKARSTTRSAGAPPKRTDRRRHQYRISVCESSQTGVVARCRPRRPARARKRTARDRRTESCGDPPYDLGRVGTGDA